jgi:hypothetical protein
VVHDVGCGAWSDADGDHENPNQRPEQSEALGG